MKHSVEEIQLKNGARGLLIDIPGASVMATRIQFRAGMMYAKNHEIYELPHLVEHLAFGANAKYKDEQEFEAEFTKNGAYHNAWTSDISVCYETECADFEWDRVMELQKLSIAEPRFNEEELKSEKSNVRSELTGYMNDYYRLLWPRVQQAVGEDVLDLPERLKTISNIELKDIREYHEAVGAWELDDYIPQYSPAQREPLRRDCAYSMKGLMNFAQPDDDINYTILGLRVLDCAGRANVCAAQAANARG